jgi:pyruvate formate lyase activating enzyme
MNERSDISGDITGIIFDIQRYSLHDGPGLRTNVFLKGCGLNCWWCSNPEGKRPLPEIAFFESECFLCGDCIKVCSPLAINITGEKLIWDPSKCNACGHCIPVCPSRALRLLGEEMSASRVVDEVLRDRVFFQSHGGLTLTGGEPALQPDFSREILKLAKAAGVHTAIETCGSVHRIHLELLLPFLDLILFDIKHLDLEMHLRMTGRDNRLIIDNLHFLLEKGVNLTIRIPVIPGFNADDASFREIARFIGTLNRRIDIHLLSYHNLGRNKYAALGQPYKMENTPLLEPAELEKFAIIIQDEGMRVSITGL